MEIRVEADKAKSIKVKLQSDEMAVRIGKQGAPPEKLRPSVATLKAQFEETVTALRSNRPISNPRMGDVNRVGTLMQPTAPSLSSFHPLLQTLLKLVWDTHMHHFQAVSSTFQEGVSMKTRNTQRLVAFRKTLDDSASTLVESMHTQAIQDVRTEFRTVWAQRLADARHALQADTSDVDELLALALEKAAASTKFKAVDLQADVNVCLGTLKETFRSRSEGLWDEWTLQMKRHKLVFEGNLKEVEYVDSQLKALKSLSPTATLPQGNREEQDDGSVDAMWKELIVMLSSMKLDFDIRLGCVHKLKTWAIESTESSKAKATTSAFSNLLQQEEDQLQLAKTTLSRTLEEQKIAQERVLRELRLACNNSLAPVDSVLKSMQLSVELALEAAREVVYVRALHDLQPDVTTRCKT
jgi:hypothetical protein